MSLAREKLSYSKNNDVLLKTLEIVEFASCFARKNLKEELNRKSFLKLLRDLLIDELVNLSVKEKILFMI